ncbi:MAG TPA: DUF4149 domain-containing protein [Acidobacteriaceae bacterium]|nr:DUF4149 domain-containing protein [Acidobacteriaceae bacterium]
MKTLIRTVVWLPLVIWIGGLFFFSVVAWASFSTVPDTHVAGTIVSKCLHFLHHEGLIAGCIVLVFLLIGRVRGVYGRTRAAFAITVIMMGCTAFSEYWIMPHMERDRLAVGGAIDNVPDTEAHHADFNRLHNISTHVEEAVLLGGVILIILLAHEEGAVRD